MSLKHAILGFLSYAPMSGYDIKKSFDRSMAHFWPADQSQIYRTLFQLVEQNLVEVEVFPREERLARKVYYITDQGRDELHYWLTVPMKLPVNRNPFLLQLNFGNKLSDDEMIARIEHERSKVQERLATANEIYLLARKQFDNFQDKRQNFFSILTIEQCIEMDNTYLSWLQSCLNRIELGDYMPKHFA